jgi:hypothetical protein
MLGVTISLKKSNSKPTHFAFTDVSLRSSNQKPKLEEKNNKNERKINSIRGKVRQIIEFNKPRIELKKVKKNTKMI